MEEVKLKVLITTSGLGSRLGGLTKYTNKALVRVGNKAVISHIIDLYKDAEFIVTLGHFGTYVRQFLELTYPDRVFDFVEVSPYDGPGSGLLKSISFAKTKLQCPFIFHVCDTILTNVPPKPDYNWMACVESDRSDFFRTVCVNGSTITNINEKGEINYDYAYVGVAGIFEYKLFWSELETVLEKGIEDSSDCHIFQSLLNKTKIYYWKTYNYYDTGSVENLTEACNYYVSKYKVLDKPEEAIYFKQGTVTKFFSNSTICANRVSRASLLNGLVPKIIDSTENFYKYKHVEAPLLARIITEEKIRQLLVWASKNLWINVETDPVVFREECNDFYIYKTEQRIAKYLIHNKTKDVANIINEVEVPSCKDMLSIIDWDTICDTIPVRFHGDFILDNILYTNGDFILLDWRQDFAGNIIAGDKYYDLAKLNHNLTVNHDILSNNDYYIESTTDGIGCDIVRSNNTVQCQQAFIKAVDTLGYDIKKIRIMTALIWLNMAPLHVYPLNKFLFYFGKYNLWRELNA